MTKIEAKTILVTGAAGWLGMQLVKMLAQTQTQAQTDLTIRCLVLPTQDSTGLKSLSPAIQVIQGDIRNPADCARFCEGARDGVLIHTAGIIHPKKVAELTEINVNGSRNLLEAAAAAGVKRAVVVSSNSPCGCNPHPDHLFDEESPYHPYMGYGRSKMRLELLTRELQRQGKLETVIIRAPWFYGPGQPPRQSLFFHMVRDGKAPIVGGGANLRSMAYVDNLAQGLILSAASPKASGQTYWIADERPYSMNEIVDTIERLLEQELGSKVAHRRLRLPGIASEVALAIDWSLQKLGFYHQKIHVLSEMNKTIACSIQKAREELGYQPEVALEEGMRRSLLWCREKQQI